MDRLAIVIPARMASVRFPGKPLIDLGGKPMLQWVCEACRTCGLDARVVVATPDPEILTAAASIGVEAMMTRPDHPSGTDRLAEVAETVHAAAYVNVQGDEPLIDPENILRCAAAIAMPGVSMASLYVAASESDYGNPAVVKVVTDRDGMALYFSRSLIPYPRNGPTDPVKKHIGLYGYRAEVLARFKGWAMTPLERTEGLEQLRFLENGIRIKMVEGVPSGTAVDTPEQADEVRAVLAKIAPESAH